MRWVRNETGFKGNYTGSDSRKPSSVGPLKWTFALAPGLSPVDGRFASFTTELLRCLPVRNVSTWVICVTARSKEPGMTIAEARKFLLFPYRGLSQRYKF